MSFRTHSGENKLFIPQATTSPFTLLSSSHLLRQVLIACLRIDEQSRVSDGETDKGKYSKQRTSAHDGDGPRDDSTTNETRSSSTQEAALASNAQAITSSPPPPDTAIVDVMGGTDAKAEELVALTGAAASEVKQHLTGKMDRDGSAGDVKGDDAEDLLELRGGAWEHVGLPRNRLVDVLLWAQRHVIGADSTAEGSTSSANSVPVGGDWTVNGGRSESAGSLENQREREEESAAAERAVASVTTVLLQGLLVGELPRGFAASVVSSTDGRKSPQHWSTSSTQSAAACVVVPPRNVTLDPFFLHTAAGDSGGSPRESGVGRSLSWRQRDRAQAANGTGARGAGGAAPRPHSQPWPNTRAKTTSRATTTVTLPLLVRLPEAFPALCQQVATAPQRAAQRAEVIETIVASVQDQRNSKSLLSVASWQQYLLSIVSSAQGRRTVAIAETFAVESDSAPTDHDDQNTGRTGSLPPEDADLGWHDRRSMKGEKTTAEEQLMNQTIMLICWLAMCEAREGKPGRPGAGFEALKDTMSFLRCQAELGTMECVSVGESMLLHMVRSGAVAARKNAESPAWPFTTNHLPQRFCLCGAVIAFPL